MVIPWSTPPTLPYRLLVWIATLLLLLVIVIIVVVVVVCFFQVRIYTFQWILKCTFILRVVDFWLRPSVAGKCVMNTTNNNDNKNNSIFCVCVLIFVTYLPID